MAEISGIIRNFGEQRKETEGREGTTKRVSVDQVVWEGIVLLRPARLAAASRVPPGARRAMEGERGRDTEGREGRGSDRREMSGEVSAQCAWNAGREDEVDETNAGWCFMQHSGDTSNWVPGYLSKATEDEAKLGLVGTLAVGDR